MEEQPAARYATAPDGVRLAYYVTGDGPSEVLLGHGTAHPMDLMWEEPGIALAVKRLRAFSRTIWYEGRGTGASGGHFVDNFVGEVMQGDFGAVLDAEGCERVALVICGLAGPLGIDYVASHPERISAFVLVNSFCHYVREPDYPVGLSPDALAGLVATTREHWGSGVTAIMAPSKAGDRLFLERLARSERLGLSPDEVAEASRICHVQDARRQLPSISVPSLVVHRIGDRMVRVDSGRYLAEHIPGARYVELPGEDHLFYVGDVDALMDEVEEFLTGVRPAPAAERVLATVLFTDIVGSTERADELGDRRWREVLDAHHSAVRRQLERFRGREVNTAGDGFLATFDGPGRAIECACAIRDAVPALGLEIRAGLHTGEIEVRADDVSGMAVHLGARVAALAGPSEVVVSSTVKDLVVGSGLSFRDRGEHQLKGVPGLWRLYVVDGG